MTKELLEDVTEELCFMFDKMSKEVDELQGLEELDTKAKTGVSLLVQQMLRNPEDFKEFDAGHVIRSSLQNGIRLFDELLSSQPSLFEEKDNH